MKKETWHIHCDDIDFDRDYSITTDPDRAGWCTDSGSPGYRLPKELAIWICKQLNDSKEICPYKLDWCTWEKL